MGGREGGREGEREREHREKERALHSFAPCSSSVTRSFIEEYIRAHTDSLPALEPGGPGIGLLPPPPGILFDSSACPTLQRYPGSARGGMVSEWTQQ